MPSKITYKLRLDDIIDTEGLTASEKDDLKNEIGEFLYDRILEDISNQRSSVSGRKWKGLKKEYAARKSQEATPVANLELTGDMLDALEYKAFRDGIEIGIFDTDEAQKADNHNKFSAKSKKTPVPKRQFIPNKDDKEAFRSGIMKELVAIAEEVVDGFKTE